MALPLILAGIQAAGGLAQILGSGKNKAQRELQEANKQTPKYGGGTSIKDYYNKALSNYNVNPYASTQYQKSIQDAQRGTNMGLSALADRRAGLAGIGKLVGIQNDNSLKAGIAAEQQQQRNLHTLGSASQMLGAEDKYNYTNNQLNPYLRRLQLLQQKAAGSAAVSSAGIQNMFGGATSAAMLLGGAKGAANTTTPTSPNASYQIPFLSRNGGNSILNNRPRNRVGNDIQDAEYEDVQDYNTMDRGLN
jgi:hypothetical protein